MSTNINCSKKCQKLSWKKLNLAEFNFAKISSLKVYTYTFTITLYADENSTFLKETRQLNSSY